MLQEEKKIIRLISEPLKDAGFDLIETNLLIQNAYKTVQIYIDSPKGIHVDDCVNANKIVKNIFVKTNQYFKDYGLEVSSPGIFRSLKTPDQFKSSTGKRIKVHLQKKFRGHITVIGDLQKCNEENICIQPDSNESDMIIPYTIISKANLEPLLKF